MASLTGSSADCPDIHSFLPLAESSDGPVIAAAGDPHSALLQAILDRAQALPAGPRSTCVLDQVHDEGLDGRWDTPLLRAIAEQRIENVRLLLRYGADPNGINRAFAAGYARRFRRFCTGEDAGARWDVFVGLKEEDVGPVPGQILPLGAAELAQSQEGISLFWAGGETPELDLSMNGESLHSLVMAAGRGTVEIFNALEEAGADARFWLLEEAAAMESIADADEDDLEPSALCLSTPLHAAITTGNLEMLRALLDKGFNPNARALIAGPRATTPMQHAFLTGRMDAYDILVAHPRANTSLLTPGYGVHALHFASAHLLPEDLAAINIPLSAAPVTALGHTLLHIASLPIDASSLQTLAPKIVQSLHFDRRSAFIAPEAPRPPTSPRPQQVAMCKHLVSTLGTAELSRADAHGNTALHYLAGTTEPQGDLIEWMRAREGGEMVWRSSRNLWGWTPEDLWNDARAVVPRPAGNGRGRGGRGRGR